MPALSSSTPPSTNGRANRAIVLKLPSSLLARFPSSMTSSDAKAKSKDASSSPSSTSGDAMPPASSVDNASDAASTPAGGTDNARKKSTIGPKAGSKRGFTNGDVGTKPRGKPGPKKKPRLDDGPADTSKLIPSTHKLGPKANQGAINAGLRALDRTGAPCRRWQRKGFQLKSFTGIRWEVPTWRAPKPHTTDLRNGESKEGVVIVENGDSDSKANQTGSTAPSEKSNIGDGDLTPLRTSVADSPPRSIAMVV